MCYFFLTVFALFFSSTVRPILFFSIDFFCLHISIVGAGEVFEVSGRGGGGEGGDEGGKTPPYILADSVALQSGELQRTRWAHDPFGLVR